jgi:hypothetical protein
MESGMSKQVLLVGSIPLSSSEEVFREVASRIGPLVRRMPDGETGDRAGWTAWQTKVMERTRGIVRAGDRDVHGIPFATYRVTPGNSPADIVFPPLGYASAAKQSYRVFERLRAEGVSPHSRFQVSLPTPLAVVQAFFWGSPDLPAVCQRYERRLLAELDEILAAIPHEILSLQWDIAVEFHRIWEKPDSELAHQFPPDTLIDTIARLSDCVPEPVELGWHFCYGDAGHRHMVEPRDMRLMTEKANALSRRTRRRANWLHMPVPRDRYDDAYFTPLGDISVGNDTEIYLGLIHLTDGVEGTRRRMAAADKVISAYGIATECGFGRRSPETVLPLLDLHRIIAEGN